ncbi:UV DNA damage repair endonuclease UvsE [Myxococcota bacterium]
MRLGLCCVFHSEAIKFRTTTATSLSKLRPKARRSKLLEIATHNAGSLQAAIKYCAAHGIGCFRVNSQILPLRTHPKFGYGSDLLGEEIVASFQAAGRLARQLSIRLTFHPDQFVVLNSDKSKVVTASIAELEYQAEVAQWIHADVINIHGGGGYGNKDEALRRLVAHVGHLSDRVRRRLTFENDDRTYTPSDLLPVCSRLKLPLVYDVHHHRCNDDGLEVDVVTQLALSTWNREPLFHVSSPRDGWSSQNPRPHSDYINLRDFPTLWDELDLTVEVEAKAKELAVSKLAQGLARRRSRKRNSS